VGEGSAGRGNGFEKMKMSLFYTQCEWKNNRQISEDKFRIHTSNGCREM
jgi:hypothetical protein